MSSIYCDCDFSEKNATLDILNSDVKKQAREFSFYVQPGGKMFGISAAETLARFKRSLDEFSQICGVRFRHSLKSSANIKIRFRPQSQMHSGALGTYHGGGNIRINDTRPVALTTKFSRVAEELLHHEVGHMFGQGHNATDKSCSMYSNISNKFFCPAEVRTYQRKFGNPPRGFHPVDRAIFGSQVREVKAKRNALALTRNMKHLLVLQNNADLKAAQGNPTKYAELLKVRPALIQEMGSAHARVLASNTEFSAIADKWFSADRRWQGTSFFAGNE